MLTLKCVRPSVCSSTRTSRLSIRRPLPRGSLRPHMLQEGLPATSDLRSYQPHLHIQYPQTVGLTGPTLGAEPQ